MRAFSFSSTIFFSPPLSPSTKWSASFSLSLLAGILLQKILQNMNAERDGHWEYLSLHNSSPPPLSFFSRIGDGKIGWGRTWTKKDCRKTGKKRQHQLSFLFLFLTGSSFSLVISWKMGSLWKVRRKRVLCISFSSLLNSPK